MMYETSKMTHKQAVRFCKQFDVKVGTERELNVIEDEYYVLCFDLQNQVEVDICRKIEESS